jgi:hypothetical protein
MATGQVLSVLQVRRVLKVPVLKGLLVLRVLVLRVLVLRVLRPVDSRAT